MKKNDRRPNAEALLSPSFAHSRTSLIQPQQQLVHKSRWRWHVDESRATDETRNAEKCCFSILIFD